MQILVAVVSWNTRELLRACLASFAPLRDRAEVVCVDNASSDGSAAMVAADFPWVRLIASDENLGFGAAVNRAVAAGADAPWLVIANADTVASVEAVDALLTAADANPDAGLLAPRLRLPDRTVQHTMHPFPGVRNALAFNLGAGLWAPRLATRMGLEGHVDFAVERPVDWAHGAFLLARRDAFDRVGGFDPHQWLYAEDIDLAWRMARAGYGSRYVPSAEVEHVHSAAISQLWGDERDLRAQRSAYAWLLRRRGPAVMRACAAINTAGAVIRVLCFLAGFGSNTPLWQLRRWTRIHLDGLRIPSVALRQHR